MPVERFIVNPLAVNCYLFYQNGEALLIDPGEASREILDFLNSRRLRLLAIINTHGHADHIAGNSWFLEKTGAPLWIHKDDGAYLLDDTLHLGAYIHQDIPARAADRLLQEGDRITVGDAVLEVWHTPGHSPGSICLYTPGLLFSGDTLFQSSVGRWDFPGGDFETLQKSLLRLVELPVETKVYPGHGPESAIGVELRTNPFLKEALREWKS